MSLKSSPWLSHWRLINCKNSPLDTVLSLRPLYQSYARSPTWSHHQQRCTLPPWQHQYFESRLAINSEPPSFVASQANSSLRKRGLNLSSLSTSIFFVFGSFHHKCNTICPKHSPIAPILCLSRRIFLFTSCKLLAELVVLQLEAG